MKREELKELGLSEEQIDKIMDINGKDITKLQHERDGLKNQVDEIGKTIAERDKQIEGFGKLAKGHEDLTKEVERLTAENKVAADKYQADLLTYKKNTLIDGFLKDVKAKNPVAVKALFADKVDKITVDGDKLVGMDDIYKDIYKGNEYMFETTTTPTKAGSQLNLPNGGDEFANYRKL